MDDHTVVDDQLLTIDEVAARLQVVPKTVRREVIRGRLRATKVGCVLRFKRAWIDDYIERRKK